MIDSGKLRHRVRIERHAEQVDSFGQVIQDPSTGQVARSWEEVATVWAAIEPLSAKEFIQSQAVQSQVSARITIRYRTGVDASMRLVHMFNGVPGSIYNIAGILADKVSGLEYLTIPVSEGVNEG